MGRIYFVVMRQSPLEIVANVRSSWRRLPRGAIRSS